MDPANSDVDFAKKIRLKASKERLVQKVLVHGPCSDTIIGCLWLQYPYRNNYPRSEKLTTLWEQLPTTSTHHKITRPAHVIDARGQKTDTEKMTEALAEFSPADRDSAMKQHFCPVSGDMLGTIGPPEKVDVSGTPDWICCDGCREKLLANSEKYVAKLAK